MADRKSPEQIERENRMFSVTEAVKLGYTKESDIKPIDHAREFFEFLQESPEIPDAPVGFVHTEKDIN